MKIDLIAGARPNFVKIAAIIHAIENSENNIEYRLIHTGQHYDESLSGNFFKDLKLPNADVHLGAGRGSQAQQTAGIMLAYEKVLKNEKPNLCLVVGDVTSSMACAITAKKMHVKVVHVEAGIRSHDWSMPEEINRVLIDSIADYFFTTTQRAKDYLLQTGKEEGQVFFVGNTMIDTLLRFQLHYSQPDIWNKLNLKEKEYFVLTLHRPNNVDEVKELKLILSEILKHSKGLPVIFPVHPRTKETLKAIDLSEYRFHFIDALGYLEFNYLVRRAKAVLTDSGGITEETTVMKIPCITIRDNTERPETISFGTNELIGTNPKNIAPILHKLFEGNWKEGTIPEKWDGKAAERIIEILSM
ncbi:non-hydrolyzing UDP-N-acetylglucosamine 2-epimerase [uncultured Christiangramia sp.]|uniref:non-hydrolyzing UDP-N-acetylglucosamine 2-epimerase n=1 Tax=uncultured Christiangramia sp. TaxID=503836 RepID=UPI0026219FB4|nr:UDP-N-acetylglucosamine 2-epimerase (non-hydrolyzing) [uncultured Christiangramia sp.]